MAQEDLGHSASEFGLEIAMRGGQGEGEVLMWPSQQGAVLAVVVSGERPHPP
jgi:hypothetical protein